MNDIEKAINDLQQHIGILGVRLKCHPEDCNIDFLSKVNSYSLAIEALQAQTERDKMRCENCKSLCGNWCDRVMDLCKPTDFCGRFEPKENENG